MQRRAFLSLAAAAVFLAGCSTIKKFTGQRDDSVLPGEREEVLTPDQHTARDPVITGQQPKSVADQDLPAPKCDPNTDQNCAVPEEPEGGVYSDGQ